MAKHIVTKEDLKENPELNKQGVKEGDEIEIPDNEANDNDDFENNDDTGGSAPPPNKGRG
jgi:hypothetical protein